MAAENVWLTELLQERGGRARHRQLFAAARGAGRLAGAACADIADTCRTPSGAETQSAAGEFAVRRRSRAGELASGAVCCAGSGVTGRGNSVLDHRDLARQAEAAQQASRAFYHRWFDGEKVINPRLQMQQHLQTLTRQAQHAPRRPPQRLAKHPQRNAGIRLRALSWDAAGNRLQLDIAGLPGRWSSLPSGRSRGFASEVGRHDSRNRMALRTTDAGGKRWLICLSGGGSARRRSSACCLV